MAPPVTTAPPAPPSSTATPAPSTTAGSSTGADQIDVTPDVPIDQNLYGTPTNVDGFSIAAVVLDATLLRFTALLDPSEQHESKLADREVDPILAADRAQIQQLRANNQYSVVNENDRAVISVWADTVQVDGDTGTIEGCLYQPLSVWERDPAGDRMVSDAYLYEGHTYTLNRVGGNWMLADATANPDRRDECTNQ